MDTEKKARLEAHGWKVGSAEEFLGLTSEEAADVDLRPKLDDAIRDPQAASCTEGASDV